MFEEFCRIKQIKGNFKEALYHHLMAKYAEYEKPAMVIDQLKKEDYETEWKIVLSQFMARLQEG